MMQMRWYHVRRRLGWIVLTVLLTTFVCIQSFQGQFFFSIAQKFQDSFLQLTNDVDQDIVVIKIDDKSLQKLGAFPWPRGEHAKMIALLDQAQAKVIGYDVAFFEGSPLTDQDQQLSVALADTTVPVVLPLELNEVAAGNAQVQHLPLNNFIGKRVQTGFINIQADQDLLVRHFPPKLTFAGKYIPSFSSAIVNQVKGTAYQFPPDNRVYLPIQDIGKYASFSFSDVLDGTVPKQMFKDKIVLVGSTAATLHDEVFIPNQNDKTPGVFLHALTIDNMLNQRAFTPLASSIVWILLMIIIVIAFGAKLFLRTFADWSITVMLLAIIIMLPFLLAPKMVIVPLFYLVLTWLVTVLAGSLLKINVIEDEREQLRSHFSLYVNKSVVDRLAQNPEKAVLGGDKREMTVLFSDIRGFTSISEQMTPADVVHFLNQYLDMMTAIVLEQGGVLDKYIGDAIMAFWGAPLPQEDHAVLGVRTAWLMQKAMKENGHLFLKNWPDLGELKIGIGLNTGMMAVGNMGSHLRFDYTVIGDNVNTASRIEGLTKYWRADILIAEATKKLVDKQFICRELDLVRVKGRTEPLRLFDILGEKTEDNGDLVQKLAVFNQAIKLYRDGKFAEAIDQFQLWKESMPQDKVVDVFIERCQDFITHPEQAKGFTGVIIMDSK
jgi:adenylate cyclase